MGSVVVGSGHIQHQRGKGTNMKITLEEPLCPVDNSSFRPVMILSCTLPSCPSNGGGSVCTSHSCSSSDKEALLTWAFLRLVDLSSMDYATVDMQITFLSTHFPSSPLEY